MNSLRLAERSQLELVLRACHSMHYDKTILEKAAQQITLDRKFQQEGGILCHLWI